MWFLQSHLEYVTEELRLKRNCLALFDGFIMKSHTNGQDTTELSQTTLREQIKELEWYTGEIKNMIESKSKQALA